jgi:hypothetical protein
VQSSRGHVRASESVASLAWGRRTYRPAVVPRLAAFHAGLTSFEFRLLSAGIFSGAGGEVRPAWRTFKTFCQLARICSDVMIGRLVIPDYALASGG